VLVLTPLTVPRAVLAQAGIPYIAPADEVFDRTPEPSPRSAPPEPAAPIGPSHTAPSPATSPLRWGKPVEFFLDLWTRHRAALAAGNTREALSLLNEVVVAKRASGWPDHFAFGEALARESAMLRRDKAHDLALAVASAAVEIAPHRPSSHWAMAWAQLGASGHILGGLVSLWRATTLWIVDPALRRMQFGCFGLALAVGLLSAVSAFAAAAVYRHARQLGHDILHLLPRFATRVQAGVIAATLLILPVICRLGFTWIVMFWLVLLGLYFDLHERVGAALSLAVLAGLPLMLPGLIHFLAYPGSRAHQTYLVARDMGAGDAARMLAARADPTADETYALGLRARWSGDLPNAAVFFKKALADGANDAELWTSLGNMRFWLGDPDGAIQCYDKAIARNPHDYVAYFDESRVYYSKAEQQKAGEAHRHAAAIDYTETESFAEQAKRAQAGFLVDEEVPSRLLGARAESTAFEADAADQIWAWFANGTPRVFSAAYALLAVVVVLLCSVLRTLMFPAGTCVRCGRPSCQRCSPELPEARDHCGDCYHAFVAEDPVEPQVRIQKELEARRYQARDARVRQVMMFLLAGTGHLVRGATWRGLAFVTAFATCLILLLSATGVLFDPVSDGFFLRPAASAVLGVVLFCVYGGALWDALREEAD
jgi:hypothetical protein